MARNDSPAVIWRWPVVVLSTGLVLTAVLAWIALWNSRARDTARFGNAVESTNTSIEAKLETYIGLLRAGAGFFAGSEHVGREEFRAVADRLQLESHYPGVQGIGYAQRVMADNRAAFVEAQRREGLPGFEITPMGDRAEYFPIVFLEPEDRRNLHAIGYDMFSEPTRREAMKRARDLGREAASKRVVLVQEIDSEKQAGFLIYVPVYDGGRVPVTVAERRERLAGFVYSPFRAGDLLTGLLGDDHLPWVMFEVYDGSEVASEQLLYRSVGEVAAEPEFEERVQLQIADHMWTVRYRTTTAFEETSSRGSPVWLTIGGVLVSGAFGFITLALARSEARARVRGEVIAESEERLRVTLSSIGDAVISTDAEGLVTFMNPVAERLTGWSLGEARARPLSEVFRLRNEDTGLPVGNPVGAVLREGMLVTLANHSVLISRHGNHIPIEDSAAPIRTAGGEMLGVVLVFHDVTEQRQARDAVRERERLLRAVASGARVGLVIVNHRYEYLFANQAYGDVVGLAADEVVGRKVPDVVTGGWRQIQPRLDRALAGERLTYELTLPPRAGGGGERFYTMIYEPQIEKGERTVVVVMVDSTELKRSERQLREAAERFRFMAESIPQKIFTAGPGGAFDYFNEQWMQFTGLTLTELQQGGWTRFVHEEDLEENQRCWNASAATGEPFQNEHRLRRQDGQYRWHLTRALAFRDAGGRVQIWVGSSTDIDDQKREEERLESTVAERTAALRETNEQLEAFVYTIAHDLRGPLRAIAGYSQLLTDDYLTQFDESGRHMLERIQGSAEFMDRLILDLLAFGRTARADIELSRVDVHKAWSIALAQTAGQREQSQAEVETIGPLPHVLAHEATLGQVFANLLTNAMKFVAPGVCPRIRLRAEENGEVVRLWVEDNGIGIPAEMKERIFRVFERLHGARYSGTGIGLSIVRKGVERMGGRVDVESTLGQGSRFWIELKKENE